MLTPVCEFSHMGRDFVPGDVYDDTDPMAVARPDLFETQTSGVPAATDPTTEA